MATPYPASPPGDPTWESPALVTIGTVTSDETSTVWLDDGTDDKSIWADYEVRNQYYRDGQLYMSGVTSEVGFNGQTAVFFQLSMPTLIWVCDWTAARFNTQPDVPDPTPVDPNWVLLDVIPETSVLDVATDETPYYRISGIYVYGHKNPSANIFNNINYPRPPWLRDQFDRTQPASKVQQGISNINGHTLTGFIATANNTGSNYTFQGVATPGSPI